MAKDVPFYKVKPDLNDLLPAQELRDAFDDALASVEAGQLVRRLRTEARLSQKALATMISVSQARISAIELGKGRDGPSYALLRRIANACGISLRSLLEDATKTLGATIKPEEPRRYSAS